MRSGLVFQKQSKELPLSSKAQLKGYLLRDKDERKEHFRLRELQTIMRSWRGKWHQVARHYLGLA